MASFWLCPKIMKHPQGARCFQIENLVACSKVLFQITYQASEVLFLRTVVRREDDQIGCNKKKGEEKLQPYESLQPLKSAFDIFQAQV